MALEQSIAPHVGNEDPTAGAEAGYTDQGDQGTQDQPAERSFTQADVDRILQERLGRAERTWERRLQDAQAQWDQRYAARPTSPQADPYAAFDPRVAEALRAIIQAEREAIRSQEIAPLRQSASQGEVNVGLADFKGRHSDLSIEDVNAVLRTALDFGDNIANSMPIDRLLDLAYYQWKFAGFDEKAFKQQAVDEYVKTKAAKAAGAPRPQGPGGAVMPTQKRPKTFADADKEFLAMMERDENA